MAVYKNIEAIFPILDVDPETSIIISKNADLTIAMEVRLPEIFTLSPIHYDMQHELFVRACQTLPVGYMLHKQDFFFNKPYEVDYSSDYFRQMNFIARSNEQHFQDRHYQQHTCFIYLTLPSSSPLKRNSANSSLFKRHLVPKLILDPATWKTFQEVVFQFKAIMADSSLNKVRILTRDDILGEKLIPGRATKHDPTPGLYQQYFSLSLSDNVLHDIDLKKDVIIGDKHTHTYTISEIGDWPMEIHDQVRLSGYSTERTPFPASTGAFFGLMLPFNHVYNQVIYVVDPDEFVKQKIAETKRHSSFSKWSRENELAATHKDEFVREIKGSNRYVIKSHFNIMVFSENQDQADSYRLETGAAINKLGFRTKIAKWDAATLFWSCIPGNIAEIGADNLATCFTENAVSLFNMETNYYDSFFQKNGIRLVDRRGRPCMVDPFFGPWKEGIIESRNFLAIGPTGSGKSFTMNNLVYYLVSQGTHMTIVDVGHSYRRLGDLLGARYITFDKNSLPSFNPFQFNTNDPSEDLKESLQNIIESLYYNKGDIITKSAQTAIRLMVHSYYVHLKANHDQWKSNKSTPLIRACYDSFHEFVRDDFGEILTLNHGRDGHDFDIQNFLFVMNAFYKGNQYGYLLNSKDNINLVEHPFIIYELDAIKDHTVLFPVVTLMIMTNYTRKLMEVESGLKVLMIEEAWKALANDNFAKFLEWCSRTVRKHFGSLGIVSQNPKDFASHPIIKDVLVNGSPIKFLLDLSRMQMGFDVVAEILGLNPLQEQIVLSVNKNKDPNRKYKDLALLLGSEAKAYGVEVSGLTYAAFTTEKTEVLEIKLLREHYGDLYKALVAWSNGERIHYDPADYPDDDPYANEVDPILESPADNPLYLLKSSA